MNKKIKNIIDGKECCWRCGISKKEWQKEKFGCTVWGHYHEEHLWSVREEKETDLTRNGEKI